MFTVFMSLRSKVSAKISIYLKVIHNPLIRMMYILYTLYTDRNGPCFGRHVKQLVWAAFAVVSTDSSFKEG
jgi:hypothetical protein